MNNFNPGTVYIYNQDGTPTRCAVYISNPDGTTIVINNTIEASFEETCRMFEEALLYISGARDVVIKCCPNRKVVYLATHSKKRRTRKKNIHRAIKILEELAEVNND